MGYHTLIPTDGQHLIFPLLFDSLAILVILKVLSFFIKCDCRNGYIVFIHYC